MIQNLMLTQVLEQVASRFNEPEEALVSYLRQSYPGTIFSVCSDNDMPPRMHAVAGNSFCRLYYIDSGEHCLSLTNDAEAATGLVVALRDWDD